jgi:ADP-heptose:LPS heptosyltransferase
MQTGQGEGLLRRLQIRELAVFRALQLGDMLCAVPALRALRHALPHARITLIGLPWAQQFAQRFHTCIDDFIAFPGHPDLPEQPVQADAVAAFHETVRARRFDLALQLHGSGQTSNPIVHEFGARTMAGYKVGAAADETGCFLEYQESGHETMRLLRLVEFLGAPAQGSHLEFPLTAQDEDELRASGVGAELEAGTYFCLHPGTRMRDKCWPPQRFAEVGDRLHDEFGLRAVITGSAQEADLAQAVAGQMHNRPALAAAPISIGAMAALMSRARLLICNDTGVSHIAAGLRLPSVVVFSKSSMERWAPLEAALHRCVWDPEGHQTPAVIAHARLLLRQ